MRKKVVTPTGEEMLNRIHSYLAERTPSAAAAYLRMALNTFKHFPDDIRLPVRAGDHLPEEVRVLHLGSPFRGYTLRVAIYDDAMYLLAAFAPGLDEKDKDQQTRRGLRDV